MTNFRFRVWDGEEMHEPPHSFLIDDRGLLWVCEPRKKVEGEVMLYTGLDDAEGEPIYEGDIVEAMDHLGKEGDPAEVFWSEPEAAWAAGKYWFLATFCKQYKVRIIGNIHKDPDLLEQT